MSTYKVPPILRLHFVKCGCHLSWSWVSLIRVLGFFITGDQLAIGKETGRRLGMGTNMYPSSSLLGAHKDESIAALPVDELIEKADGFAGVFPGNKGVLTRIWMWTCLGWRTHIHYLFWGHLKSMYLWRECVLGVKYGIWRLQQSFDAKLCFLLFAEHKYEIVRRLQDKKHIVGMTGDGVNDAPALKKADIGIAVADATDAARSASDIVLTEPGLSVIISAVLTSRAIFQRMKNYTVCKLQPHLEIKLSVEILWCSKLLPRKRHIFLEYSWWSVSGVVLGLVVFADLRRFYHHPYCGKCEITIAPLCGVLVFVNWAFAVKRIYLLILPLSCVQVFRFS